MKVMAKGSHVRVCIDRQTGIQGQAWCGRHPGALVNQNHGLGEELEKMNSDMEHCTLPHS